jgi:hypothetical protein
MTKELTAAREKVKSLESKLSTSAQEVDELRTQFAASEKSGSNSELNQRLETANERNEGSRKASHRSGEV